MTQLKAGDRVQYSVSGGTNPKYHYAGMRGQFVRGDAYGSLIRWDDGHEEWHSPNYIIPEVVLDDPLPPAPESVRYVGFSSHKYRDLTVQIMPSNLWLDVNAGDDRGNSKSVLLDADSALQLAHDLTRMAMEMKRKQRAAEQN